MVSRDDTRGQLLLIGAISIALVVLGTVVMLNGMKFTDTIGSEGAERGLDRADRKLDMVQTDVTRLVTATRNQTGIRPGLGSIYDENLTRYSRLYANMSTVDGVERVQVRMDPADSRRGWSIVQSSTNDFQLPSAPTADPTTVATESTILRPFEMTVERFPCNDVSSFGPTGSPDNYFEATVSTDDASGSDEWRIRLYAQFDQDGGVDCQTWVNSNGNANGDLRRYIEVYDESGLQLRKTSQSTTEFGTTDPVRFDFVEGTLNGDGDDSLSFYDGDFTVAEPYELTFENVATGGESLKYAQGKYRIGTFRPSVPPSDYEADEFTRPDVQQVIVKPDVEITYIRPGIRYGTEGVVDEGDGGKQLP